VDRITLIRRSELRLHSSENFMDKIIEWVSGHKDNVTSWTAILAVIASTISIFVAAINMKLQRIHYRKTLLPIGSLILGDYEQEIFVRLRNDGAGPMILNEISVYRAGERDKIGSALIDFMPEGLGWITFVKDISRSILLRSEAMKMIHIFLMLDARSVRRFQSCL
jgi:hypothetical protein